MQAVLIYPGQLNLPIDRNSPTTPCKWHDDADLPWASRIFDNQRLG